jgi:hypothetical protein
VTLKDRFQCANRIAISYIDRLRKYRNSSFQVDHFLAQEDQGEIISEDIDYVWFSDTSTAGRQAWRLLKEAQYDTKIFSMILRPKFLGMRIGEVYQLNVPSQSLTDKIRIMSIDEPSIEFSGAVQVTAKLETSLLNSFEAVSLNESGAVDTAATPPTDVIPVIMEQTALHNDDILTLCLGAWRLDDSVVGADVYVSEDGSTYHFLDTLTSFVVVGDIAANVAAADRDLTVNVDAYLDTFAGVSVSEQRDKISFCMIGDFDETQCGLTDFEFISFREVEPATGTDLLLKNCYRDKYYTKAKPHVVGTKIIVQFGVDKYLKYRPNEPKVGRTIYIKMQAFNIAGDAVSLDDTPAIEYTIHDYTRKATHVAGLQTEVGGVGQKSIRTVRTGGTPNRDVRIIWRDTARAGGISRTGVKVWPWNSFIASDRNEYDVLVYDSAGTLIATHENIGNVFAYDYTEAQNAIDFSGFTSDIMLGVRPRNPRGSVPDVKRIPVFIDP